MAITKRLNVRLISLKVSVTLLEVLEMEKKYYWGWIVLWK